MPDQYNIMAHTDALGTGLFLQARIQARWEVKGLNETRNANNPGLANGQASY